MSDSTESSRPQRFAEIARGFAQCMAKPEDDDAVREGKEGRRADLWEEFAELLVEDLDECGPVEFTQMPFTIADEGKTWRAIQAVRAGKVSAEGRELYDDLRRWRNAVLRQEIMLEQRLSSLLCAAYRGRGDAAEAAREFLRDEHGFVYDDELAQDIDEAARRHVQGRTPLKPWMRNLTRPPSIFDPGGA